MNNDKDVQRDVEEIREYASFLLTKLEERYAELPPGQVRKLRWPPGMMGDFARYLYVTSPTPVQELAIGTAIAVVAAVCRPHWAHYRSFGLPVLALRNLDTANETMHVAVANLIQQLPSIKPIVADTLLVEMTPEFFLRVRDGNVSWPQSPSAFLIIEEGLQPGPNEHRHWMMPKQLFYYSSIFVQSACALTIIVDSTSEARAALKTMQHNVGRAFGIQTPQDEWYRKGHDLAALLAIADGFWDPTMNVEHVAWAFEVLVATRQSGGFR